VVVWGCNRYGQLCQDPALCRQVNDPTILDQRLFDNERIVQVASGWTHMLALTSELMLSFTSVHCIDRSEKLFTLLLWYMVKSLLNFRQITTKLVYYGHE
jgi:hypothetical protein